jgi:Spy/CpxP family protein refolding chaperone
VRRLLPLVVAALVGLGSVASAAPEGRRAALREKVRATRIARIIETLRLDAAEAARLQPILDRGYDEIGRVSRQSGAARRELRALLASPSPDDARINQLIDLLAQNRTRIDQIQQEMIRGVRQVMTPVKAGWLVLTLPEIERQLQQQIRRAARGAFQGAPAAVDDLDDHIE